MRTVAGLIVGLALGILLMYAAVSTFRVQRLKQRPPATPTQRAEAPDGAAAPSLARRLGVAAAQAARTDLGATTALLLLGDTPEKSAAQAAAGFREAAAEQPEITLIEATSTAAAWAHVAAATCLFCPDHDTLRELLEDAGDRVLPPIYTVGCSDWLLAACAGPVPPVAGVALVDPGAAVRLLTPAASAISTPVPTLATIPITVLKPLHVAALFRAAAAPATAIPTIKP